MPNIELQALSVSMKTTYVSRVFYCIHSRAKPSKEISPNFARLLLVPGLADLNQCDLNHWFQ